MSWSIFCVFKILFSTSYKHRETLQAYFPDERIGGKKNLIKTEGSLKDG